VVVINWNNVLRMTARSSESLDESLSDKCQIKENDEIKLLFYAISDFTATSSDQVSASK